MAYRRTTAIVVISWLYLLTGAAIVVAPFFAFQAADGLGVGLALVPLGALVLAAGIGLLRGATWGWLLAALIALSGVAVTVTRLWAGGPPEGLVPPLVTNLITLLALYLARAPRGAEAGAGGSPR